VEPAPPTVSTIPFRKESSFRAGRLGDSRAFWAEQILPGFDEQRGKEVLQWLASGVDVVKYFIDGVPPAPAEYRNRVPREFEAWTSKQIEEYLASGALRRWSSTQEGGSQRAPKPQVVLPLSIEPEKPRLIVDARYLNQHTQERPFTMETIGCVPALCPPGSTLVSADHKSGFHHVPLSTASQNFFGIFWKGEYYVWTVLVFGYSLSPWIYQTLSDAMCHFVRGKGIPVTSWIDDFLAVGAARPASGDNAAVPPLWPPAEAAGHRAAYLLFGAMHLAGYWVSLSKSVLAPTRYIRYLGLDVDADRQMFWVPEDKKKKFLALVRSALDEGGMSFGTLEKIAGKAVSMSKAVPAAVLFCRSMFRTISEAVSGGSGRPLPPQHGKQANRHTVPKHMWIPLQEDLRTDLSQWLLLDGTMNGGPWLEPAHESVRVETDASSRRWAGVIYRRDEQLFQAAAEFSPADAVLHINIKEMLAILRCLRAFAHTRGATAMHGKRFDFWVDNKVAVAMFRDGGGRSPELTRRAQELFALQNDFQFTCSFQWWDTKANWAADALTREDPCNDVTLSQWVFAAIYERWGPIGIDWMATPASVRLVPGSRTPLPFISRYHTGAEVAVNVLAQRMDSCIGGVGYCFPPPQMRLAVIEHALRCHSTVIFILPDRRDLWWPILLRGRPEFIRLRELWPNDTGPGGPLFGGQWTTPPTTAATNVVHVGTTRIPDEYLGEWLAVLCRFP